jgi:hypothetical protein
MQHIFAAKTNHMKTKILVLLLLLLGATKMMHAQDYKTAVGVRGGFYNGLSGKHYLNNKFAVEGLLTTRWYGFMATGFLQLSKPTKIERLRSYAGLGAHVSSWNSAYYYSYNSPYFNNGRFLTFGADAILGIEYTTEFLPLNFALDVHPLTDFTEYGMNFYFDIGLSIRWVMRGVE